MHSVQIAPLRGWTIFAKSFIVDVRLSSKYVSGALVIGFEN